MNPSDIPTNYTLVEPASLLNMLTSLDETEWEKRGANAALQLFRRAAERVPAYGDFLRRQGLGPAAIETITDFRAIPPTSKDTYLRQYPRKDLCWDGQFAEKGWIISTTSGSTGEPFYFPRTKLQDEQYALTAELYLRRNFRIHERSTLYIVGFPMGAWIGGVFTYEALRRVAERGDYALSIITPGINKHEIIKAVQNLGRDFDQIIIGSYAPFLRDILDDGERAGLDWPSYRLGFIFSAEGFSETFRNYVIRKAGLEDPLRDTLNHYGTVDLGTMSHETPVAILVRRLALRDPTLYAKVFGELHRLPTLTQYLPEMFYFESHEGDIFCTADSGLPLIRYDLKDRGDVFTTKELVDKFRDCGYDLVEELEKAGIAEDNWNLPFVQVYERSDFSVSFYAFQIYPETIRKALHGPELEEDLTGKFTMIVDFDEAGRQHLNIHLELRQDKEPCDKLALQARESIVKHLRDESSEYRETSKTLGLEAVAPTLHFWSYEHPEHFRPGTKQKWVKK